MSLFASRACALAIAFLMSVSLAGCAGHSGAALFVDVGAGASAELQALSRRAATGDKRAQYELALRFEEGRGVPIDNDRAIKLYALALTASETRWIYLPSAGRQSKASVLPVQDAQLFSQTEDAQRRLARLKAMAATSGD